ncbi:uncharacterized protein [Eurosta solidaginis]|uniref:uncharacterized protein n=1 Tax=Eurosta solidaginis TaxID=178769 RepID=UPI003530DE85
MPAIERAVKGLNASFADVRCCYQQILRVESDDKTFKLLPCALFHQDFTLPEQIDYILTECYITQNKKKKTLQKDAFSFIQQRRHQPSITDKKLTSSSSFGIKKPNVLLLGIDSLSRINFRRTMPRTFQYLQENHWFELQGFNKIGDNTFPNLMALLTSYNETTAFKKCNPRIKGGLNEPMCNLIWNNFKNFGYKTAYAEDSWTISTFDYLKKGFLKSPTDYYLRPMSIAVAKKLDVKNTRLQYCAGRKHYAEYIFDYALQFANILTGDPLFGLFWANSFSHEHFYAPATMDLRILKYFESMKKDGIFENSIIIFFGDHGVRWGELLNLKSAFLEERLPMMFISLPAWYQHDYPNFVKALEINQHRLTSPYDIYATMKHILEVAEPAKKFHYLNDTIQGASIFSEIPENRTCNDAGITEHWCTCCPYDTLPKSDGTAKKVTNLILNEINKYVANKNVSSKCSKLTLKNLNKIEMKIHEKKKQSVYRLKFTANPKKAQFQATVIYNSTANKITINVEDISRLDSYAKTAGCIDLKEAKKFCVCTNNNKVKH